MPSSAPCEGLRTSVCQVRPGCCGHTVCPDRRCAPALPCELEHLHWWNHHPDCQRVSTLFQLNIAQYPNDYTRSLASVTVDLLAQVHLKLCLSVLGLVGVGL
jgi:hypothetical protein